MSTLRKVRRPPLLEPPAYEAWRDITPKDLGLMEHDLKRWRTCENGGALANSYEYMRGLSLIKGIPPGDAELIRSELKWWREREDGLHILWILHAIKALGFEPVRITRADRRAIMKKLEEDRKIHTGYGIANTLFHMKGLGLRAEPTETDRKDMERSLKDSRKRREGWNILSEAYWMRGLGMTVDIEDEDIEAIRKKLDELRQRPSGESISYFHHLIRELKIPYGKTAEPQQLPPLKEYVR